MHRLIGSEALAHLDVWDQRVQEWRTARPDEIVDDRAPLLLVHFWATWCKPCVAEFPVWRDLGPRLEALHKGKLRILYVAIQSNNGDMERFLPANKDRMPPPPWYLDVGDRVSALARKGLPDAQLPVPVTLWLDRQRVVRQVLSGPIGNRRAEVIDSTARLVALIEELDKTAKTPSTSTPKRPAK